MSPVALSSSGGLPEDVQKVLLDQGPGLPVRPQDDRRHLLGGSGLSTWPEGRRSRQACGTRALIALLPGCDDRDLFVPAGQERHPIRAEGPTPRPAPAGAAEEPIPTSLVNGCSGPADDAVLQLYPPRVDEPTSTGRPEGHLHWWSACSPQWPRSITPAGAGGP
jgi:hypothetical protein